MNKTILSRYFEDLEKNLIAEGWTPPQETDPKPLDWSRYKGCVMEVSDNKQTWWLKKLVNVDSSDCPFRTGMVGYKHIRIPELLTLALLPHDGSECPVDDDQRILYMSEGMTRPGIAQADILKWEGVTAYLPLNFVLPE